MYYSLDVRQDKICLSPYMSHSLHPLDTSLGSGINLVQFLVRVRGVGVSPGRTKLLIRTTAIDAGVTSIGSRNIGDILLSSRGVGCILRDQCL